MKSEQNLTEQMSLNILNLNISKVIQIVHNDLDIEWVIKNNFYPQWIF